MSGSTVISCPAPYGEGGLGRHLAQVVEENRSVDRLARYFCRRAKQSDTFGTPVLNRWTRRLVRWTPFRFSPAWSWFLDAAAFDRSVAKQLPKANTLIGFDGISLKAFQAARRAGYSELQLEAAMSHVDHVIAQVERSWRDCPIERPNIHPWLARRCRQEYAEADVIWYTSELTRRTLLDAGIPDRKLRRRDLRVPERFSAAVRRPPMDGIFRVVYIGSISQRKGIHVAVEAFRRLPGAAELRLVGGSGTRAMRRYIEENCAADARIKVTPGDPLPHLAVADVCVHPSYEDGFAYAPMEALACAVPVIVSESTGMKEHVRPGVNGYIVPTGDIDAVHDRLVHIRKNPLVPMTTNAVTET